MKLLSFPLQPRQSKRLTALFPVGQHAETAVDVKALPQRLIAALEAGVAPSDLPDDLKNFAALLAANLVHQARQGGFSLETAPIGANRP
jgi:hypothetical protein